MKFAHSLKDPQKMNVRFTNLITDIKAIVVPMNGIIFMFDITWPREKTQNVF